MPLLYVFAIMLICTRNAGAAIACVLLWWVACSDDTPDGWG